MTPMALDHLFIAAGTLEEGVAWCEATLGITPGPGGRHALMSTHNRLFSIASRAFPSAYAEIIAIDPHAPPPGRARWYGLDQPALQAALRQGPQLVHWVARTPHAQARLAALKSLGLDGGEVLSAERQTPHGWLRWQISVRPDGVPLGAGALPTWITWEGAHPGDSLPDQGVALQGLSLGRVAPEVASALELPAQVSVSAEGAAPAVRAVLATPQGEVVLRSPT
ncbi:MAG: VOC family protein [Rhizobacter sp.]|nr:VOC family protein [Rhizobacter sp.]